MELENPLYIQCDTAEELKDLLNIGMPVLPDESDLAISNLESHGYFPLYARVTNEAHRAVLSTIQTNKPDCTIIPYSLLCIDRFEATLPESCGMYLCKATYGRNFKVWISAANLSEAKKRFYRTYDKGSYRITTIELHDNDHKTVHDLRHEHILGPMDVTTRMYAAEIGEDTSKINAAIEQP